MPNKAREWARNRFMLAVLGGLGLCLIVLASQIPGEPYRGILASIGGVFVGSSLSLYITGIFAPQPLEQILDLLADIAAMPWRPSESEVHLLRRQFYGYLRTQHSGETLWLYRDFDFASVDRPGHIEAVIKYPVQQRISRYRYFGFPVMKRLTLVGLNMSIPTEQAVIQVIPSVGHKGIHAGLAFVETDDERNIVTPTLMCDRPIIALTEQGVVPKELAAELDAIWLRSWRSEMSVPRAPEGAAAAIG